MAKIDALENLPEINLLDEEGITYDSILNEMVEDYEARWEELKGESLTLYPGDSRKLILNTIAGKLYQLAAIMNERFKMNFLPYMYGDFLKNWASNFGFKEDGREYATATLRFYLSAEQETNVTIPEGTRATNGDNIYFATDEALIIAAGQTHADVSATCTEDGTAGNGYLPGQLNIIADPVNLVEKVENTTESTGGHDEYTNQELRELIYDFPATYSTAGPEECYEELVKGYSGSIADVRVAADDEACVKIYVLLLNGKIPDEEYRNEVAEYLKDSKKIPDTDKIEVLAPTPTEYRLEATYYISSEQKGIAESLQSAIEGAAEEFTEYTAEKIGRAITPDTLITYMKAAGAYRVELTSPEYRAIEKNEVAVCPEVALTYGGLEEE